MLHCAVRVTPRPRLLLHERNRAMPRAATGSCMHTPQPHPPPPTPFQPTTPTWNHKKHTHAAAPAGGLTKLLANARALLFALWTFTLAVPLFAAMLAMAPIVWLTDKFRRLAQHFVNDLWAAASTAPFYRVTVVGREHLPPAGSPAVYVANHQSFMVRTGRPDCLLGLDCVGMCAGLREAAWTLAAPRASVAQTNSTNSNHYKHQSTHQSTHQSSII